MKSALLVLLYMLVFSPLRASADRVIVSDPNENGAITAKMYAETDPNLAKKVSYEAKFKPVRQIIDDLSQLTGVKLIAGARDSDWTVRSRKMNIFVKDVRLSELMDSIARTMKFRWSRYDDTKPLIYRLKVDGSAETLAETQRADLEKANEERWRKVRQEWVDAIMKYGTLSPAEAEPLRQSDVVAHRFARYGAVQAVRALFVEVPEAKERYLAGQSFRISADELTSATKELFYSAGSEFFKYMQYCERREPVGYQGSLNEDDNYDVAYRRIDTTSFTPNLRWGIFGMLTSGDIYISKQDFYGSVVDLLDRNSDWNKYICACRNVVIDRKGDIDDAYPGADVQIAKVKSSEAEREEKLCPSEPLIDHKPFPEMEKKVKLAMQPDKPEDNPELAVNRYISSVQKAIFDATGLNIVSDSWANIEGEKLSDKDMTLGDVLDQFAKNYNYNWDKPDSILEFRYRKWADVWGNQIPDEWVAAWDQDTRDNGFIKLDDLATISTLRFGQAEEAIKCDRLLCKNGMYPQLTAILDDNLTWLRLYASLSPRQKKILAGSDGLNGFALTSAQWKLAQPMFDRIGSTRSEAIMRLVYTVSKAENSSNATFTEVDLSSPNDIDRYWETYLPGYDPGWEQVQTKQ